MRLLAKHLFQFRSNLDTTSHHYDINIVGRTLQKEITYITTYHITLQMQRIRCIRNLMEYIFV